VPPDPRITYGALLLSLVTSACTPAGDDESASETAAPTSTSSAITPSGPSTGETPSSSTGSTGDTAPSCAGPLALCAATCVDLDHDPEHCGECDRACDDGLTCHEGLCGVACGPTTTACGESCADLELDPENCGECGKSCDPGESCITGACTPECLPGTQLCAGECVSPSNDEAHCGACETTCAEGQVCAYDLCVDTAVNYVLIGGQSLSLGHGSMVLSTEQPYANRMLSPGVRAGNAGLDAFVPLVESLQGPVGETIASGLANLVAELELAAGREHVMALSAHGISGQPYSVLKKGSASFAAGMAQVAAAAALAEAAGETFALRAVTVIHGESDHLGNNQNYDESLLEWQSDYEADAIAITGQLHPVPLFLCQMSSFTKYGSATSRIPIDQLAAADARPDRIYVVGPKYFLPYVDGVHLSGDGERWLGEHYAKAYRRVLVDGEPWIPLRPRALSRDGATITIDFEVPAPPLVLDEELVSNPGNYGFEFADTSGATPTIVDVSLVGETAVQITLDAPPIGGNRRVRYAYTGIAGQPGGPMTGARGNLRDSDPTPSRHDYPLYNWAVHFDVAVD